MEYKFLEFMKSMNEAAQGAEPFGYPPLESTGVRLAGLLSANLLLVGRRGEVLLSYNSAEDLVKNLILEKKRRLFLDERAAKQINSVIFTYESKTCLEAGIFTDENSSALHSFKCLVMPICASGARHSTLVLYRNADDFSCAEISAAAAFTVAAALIFCGMKFSKAAENRDNDVIASAIKKLSYSERQSISIFLKGLKTPEGQVVVASRVATEAGFTRSVIVSAMRKLESAGLIETKSLGVKGTYVKVLNEKLIKEIDK